MTTPPCPTDAIIRIEANHGPIEEFTLQFKPLSATSPIKGDGVYWWTGTRHWNAFGLLAPFSISYSEERARDFLRAVLKIKTETQEA